MTIENWRAEINQLDDELLRSLNQRAELALRVGESKHASGVSLCDHTRESEVIQRMCRANQGPLDDRAVIELFRAVIHESRRIQAQATQKAAAVHVPDPGVRARARRVAFQGEPGAFSEEAATKLLGPNITLNPAAHF